MESDHSRGRGLDETLSRYQSSEQETSSRLRQADDLLPPFSTDDCRDVGYSNHLNARRTPSVPEPPGGVLLMGGAGFPMPSARGELEIADVINNCLERGELRVELLGRGFARLDTGTHDSLFEASTFVETIGKRQRLKIACIEEVAHRMGYIDSAQITKLALTMNKTGYGKYLLKLIKEEKNI